MERTGSARHPRLVVAGGAGAVAALVVVARRPVGPGRSGQVGQMLLLPRPARRAARRRRFLDDVMQPGMPLRRHLGSLGLALVEHPALLAGAGETASTLLVAVVFVAERIAADLVAAQPCVEPGRNRHRKLQTRLEK